MTPLFHQRILFALVLSLLIVDLTLSQAQTIETLKAGIGEITVTVAGQHRVGTGFMLTLRLRLRLGGSQKRSKFILMADISQ